MWNQRFVALLFVIFGAALMRLVPHPWNFTPIGAMALFGGAHFSQKRWAFAIPFGALLLSDLLLGVYSSMMFVYASFALMVALGLWLRQQSSFRNIALATLLSSVQFFVITNFGSWLMEGLYPKTVEGLTQCYIAAIPFFRNTVLGDMFYVSLLFGGFWLAELRLPGLREKSSAFGRL